MECRVTIRRSACEDYLELRKAVDGTASRTDGTLTVTTVEVATNICQHRAYTWGK